MEWGVGLGCDNVCSHNERWDARSGARVRHTVHGGRVTANPGRGTGVESKVQGGMGRVGQAGSVSTDSGGILRSCNGIIEEHRQEQKNKTEKSKGYIIVFNKI